MSLHHIDSPHDGLYDQAAEWVSRLASDHVSESDREQFALWLATSPAHQLAMDTTLDLWEDMAVVKFWDLNPAQPSIRPASATRRTVVGGALAIAASVLAFTLLPLQTNIEIKPDRYQTSVGEQLTVNLVDGSRLMLNTDSVVTVDYQAEERKLALLKGEAFFQVAHDKNRPFIVTTDTADVTALGTAFNIFRRAEVSEITVTEGVVEVRESASPTARAAAARVVHADMSVRSGPAGISQPGRAEPGRVTAWQRGLLPADGMNLAELVSQLQRYHKQRILIGSPTLSQRTVSGVFDLSQPDSIVKALAHSLDITVKNLDDGSVVLIATRQ